MQALGQCGDADPVRPAGWADLLWWRRADANGQRAGGQGGANASERQRACKDRCPQRRQCPINEPFVYWRSGCEWKRWRRRNGLRGASTWAFGPISITYCAGNGGEAYDEMLKYYNTKNRPVYVYVLELGINEVCEIARGIVKELRDLPVGVGFGYLAPGHWSTGNEADMSLF